jgi:hypothetical protein
MDTNNTINKHNERKSKERKWWRDPTIWTNICIASFTFCLVGVGVLQWKTLKKTDKTWRVVERAFVYIDSIAQGKVSGAYEGAGDVWHFLPMAINNGTTQTVGLAYDLICEYGSDVTNYGIYTSVLGPKQEVGLGACHLAGRRSRNCMEKQLAI